MNTNPLQQGQQLPNQGLQQPNQGFQQQNPNFQQQRPMGNQMIGGPNNMLFNPNNTPFNPQMQPNQRQMFMGQPNQQPLFNPNNPQGQPGMVNPQIHPQNQFARMKTFNNNQQGLQNTLDPTGQGRIAVQDNRALQGLEENRNLAYENTQAGCGAFQAWCAAYICPCCCASPYQTVPTGFVGVIMRFGKFHKLLKPGLHFLNPDVDTFKLVDMRERAVDLRSQVVVTKDNMSLQVQAVLFYKIFDAHRAMFRVDDVSLLIRDLAITTMRNVVGNMTMQEFLEKREDLDDAMLAILEKTVPGWGSQVLRVLVQDVVLPLEFRNTMSSSALSKRIGEAKLITAQADVEAARLMRDAAEALSTDAALQIRYLDSLELLARTPNPKMVFFPSDYREIGSANEHLVDEISGLLRK
jgi:erythrocyte band 7 integral membrane protein